MWIRGLAIHESNKAVSMSTSLLYHGFGLRGYDYTRTRYTGGAVYFHIEPKPELLVSQCCRSRLVKRRGVFDRTLRLPPMGKKPAYAVIKAPRLECLVCGAVRQIRLGVAEARRFYSRSFERLVLDLSGMMTLLDVARHLKIGWDSVKDIVKRNLARRFAKPRLGHLRRLAIDEISVAKRHRYLTVVLDLDSGAVVFVGDGKGAESLKPFWRRLRKARAKIEAISTDMSPAYIAAVTENCPKTALVFDHYFHIVKLMNDHISALRRQLHHDLGDGAEKDVLKGARWLLLKRPENLSKLRNEERRLQKALELNAPLAKAYYMKEDLRQIWSQTDKTTATLVLDGWIEDAKSSGLPLLIKMGNTLAKYRDGILNWYDHRISSGPLEGVNNKIKTLKRQAYGFRDIEFFKLRIMAIHQAKYALTG